MRSGGPPTHHNPGATRHGAVTDGAVLYDELIGILSCENGQCDGCDGCGCDDVTPVTEGDRNGRYGDSSGLTRSGPLLRIAAWVPRATTRRHRLGVASASYRGDRFLRWLRRRRRGRCAEGISVVEIPSRSVVASCRSSAVRR